MRPAAIALLLPACCPAGSPAGDGDPVIFDVPETERWTIPGLGAEAHVVRTEGNVPHVYAADREDAARALGFVMARVGLVSDHDN